MSNRVKDLHDYDLIENYCKCGIISLKFNFYKEITKKKDFIHNAKTVEENIM